MPDQLFNHLLNHSYTKSDLLHRVRLLRSAVEKNLYSKTDNQQFFDLIPAKLYKDFTKKDLYAKIGEYTKQIRKLPEITLILPFSPEEKNLAEITTWLRKELKPTLLVNIKLDTNLGAGCSFIVDGIYYDYSINKELKQAGDKMRELLTKLSKQDETEQRKSQSN